MLILQETRSIQDSMNIPKWNSFLKILAQGFLYVHVLEICVSIGESSKFPKS